MHEACTLFHTTHCACLQLILLDQNLNLSKIMFNLYIKSDTHTRGREREGRERVGDAQPEHIIYIPQLYIARLIITTMH